MHKRLWIKAGPSFVAATLMLVMAWSVNTALAQGPVGGVRQPAGGGGPPTPVASRINYQGVLKESGALVTGNRNLTFDFYTDNACATSSIYNQLLSAVPVNNGLFSVYIDLPQANVYGQALWLRLTVGATIVNCDEVRPVPYALSMRPGATIFGDPATFSGSVLNVGVSGYFPSGQAIYASASTGSAVYGSVPDGTGVAGTSSFGYGVYGSTTGITNARGYGGYFYSQSGVGVFGKSDAASYYTNQYAPGVYGKSANGAGVYGVSSGAIWPAYGGVFQGRSGLSALGDSDYGAVVTSANYRGLYGHGASGWYDAVFDGNAGIYAAAGIHSPVPVRTIAVNGGSVPLAPGDIVAIAGVSTLPGTNQMMLSVRKADAVSASAVIGVVGQVLRGKQREVVPRMPSFDFQLTDSPAANGDYVDVVTSGLVMVNAAKTGRAPAMADWLAVSADGAVSQVDASSGATATLIGKAAGPIDAKTGRLPMFVILR